MQQTGHSVEGHMGLAERTMHAFMILTTAGLWLPVYLMRKHKIERTTRHYA